MYIFEFYFFVITINLYRAHVSTLIDQRSFLTKELSLRELLNGTRLMKQNPIGSLTSLKSSFALFPNVLAFENVNWMYELLGKAGSLKGPKWFEEKLRKLKYVISSGRFENSNGNYKLALNNFESILQYYPYHPEGLFLKCSSLEKLGLVEVASNSCRLSILHNPVYTNAILNLASFYQKYGQVEDSISLYEEAVMIYDLFAKLQPDKFVLHDDYVKIGSNLALAYFQLGNLLEAIDQIKNLSIYLRHGLELLDGENSFLRKNPNNSDESNKLICHSLAMLKGNEVIIKRSASLWEYWEINYVNIKNVSLSIINSGLTFGGPLLPFDTLLFYISLRERLLIAAAMARSHYLAVNYNGKELNVYHHSQQPLEHTHPLRCSPLRIGLISYDFNDHPSARLIEGIFRFTKQYKDKNSKATECEWYNLLKIYVYSYGKNDNSMYRWVLENLSDKFHDLASLSHEQSASLIVNDQIDVLLEMQLHTLGNRLEITATKPCQIIVNYLVYPGTSGATFIDYLFADFMVVPVEHVQFYSESLIYVQPSYQISYYEDNDTLFSKIKPINHDSISTDQTLWTLMEIKTDLRRANNLPVDLNATIFCNFNKIDKIEPVTFATWMNILRKLPNSYLWLLKPTSGKSELYASERGFTSQNHVVMNMIYESAAFHGISPTRIVFAERVSKTMHIERHLAADLFLDTFIYGAHSTATDALRGGLPVLTMLGDSFPNRVAASLYHSFISIHPMTAEKILLPLLVTHNIQEYEQHAIELCAHGKLSVMKLHQILLKYVIEKGGIFDSERHVKVLAAATQGIKEVSSLFPDSAKKWNVIVDVKKNGSR